MTTDDSFSIPSPANKKAMETASALIVWSDCSDNYMYAHLDLCIRKPFPFSPNGPSMGEIPLLATVNQKGKHNLY